MAIAGLAILGLESIVIAPASAPLAAVIADGSLVGLQQIAIQVLLVVLIVTLLAVELSHRSRLAYAVALVIGLVPVAWWITLFTASNPLALQPLPVRLAAAALLVLGGLGLEWPAFWLRGRGALRA